jgi:hypothetical protein
MTGYFNSNPPEKIPLIPTILIILIVLHNIFEISELFQKRIFNAKKF